MNVETAMKTFFYGVEAGLEDIIFYAINTLGYVFENNDGSNEYAIKLAITNGHLDIVKLLYKNGVKITDEVLSRALQHYDVFIVEFLLKETKLTGEFPTSLSMLVTKDFEVFMLFVNNIGKEKISMDNGLKHATYNQAKLEFIRYFIENGAKLFDDFFEDAIERQNYSTTKYLLSLPEFDINKTQYPALSLSNLTHCLASNSTFTCNLKNGKCVIEIDLETQCDHCEDIVCQDNCPEWVTEEYIDPLKELTEPIKGITEGVKNLVQKFENKVKTD